MVTGSEETIPLSRVSNSDRDSKAPAAAASVAGIVKLASSLSPEDRLRIIAGIWASLPPWHSAAPTTAQVVELQRALQDYDGGGTEPFAWAAVRRLIAAGCPKEPAKIYSAPRRFDLSTLFVVTLAFSLLFGTMAGLSFPPTVSVVVGVFILLVGAGQALLFGGKRPRTASLIVGTLSYAVPIAVEWIANGPRMYPHRPY